MKATVRVLIVAAIASWFASSADAQIVPSLLVGHESGVPTLDRYNGATGAYLGSFATGSPAANAWQFAYGPDNNLYVTSNTFPNPIYKFNGSNGGFIGTFAPTDGTALTFGPDGNLYRLNGNGTNVLRYSGTTGQLLGTFVSSGLTAGQPLHFGPGGDLFVGDGNSIKRFSGTNGTPLGNFTTPGAGGLSLALDFLFTPNGKLIVSGGSGSPNDKIFQFDSSTGTYQGLFAQGNGLNIPWGMALGPDGSLFVANGGIGGNAILHFDTLSGAFLGNFVPATAHMNPRYIGFMPVPEPSALILGAWALALLWVSRTKREGRSPISAPNSCREQRA